MLFLGVFAFAIAGFAAAAKKTFDLPAGDAAQTLKSFSAQSGEQIVYPVEVVRGSRTNPVRGEYTAREALDVMLDKSGLVAVEDAKTGALAVRKSNGAETPGEATPARDTSVEPAREPSTSLSADGDAIVLSPFEVTADNSEGYAAATTLAGNRLNTNLRDLGSAISVVTSQMLSDIGATSNETLLQYTASTEVGNIYGNMANAGSGNQLDETSRFVQPNMNTRVRGLASADNTIDYFLTDVPWDSYNVDRVDMQRGPNAILFGLGSPAGIINAGTKQAGYKNRGKVEFRTDRFGSRRWALDYNHVLLPRELSIRINALHNDEKFQQDPAFQKDERIAGALRFEPRILNQGSARTTIRLSYEKGHINSNRPRTVPPSDLLTPWFHTGTAQGYDITTGAPMQYNNLNRMGFDARGVTDQNIANTQTPGRGEQVRTINVNGSNILNPQFQPWLGGQFTAGYFGGPMATFPSGDSSTGRLDVWEPATINGLGSSGAVDGSITGLPSLRMTTLTTYRDWANRTGQPGAVGGYGLARAVHVTDPSVFDFYNKLIDGHTKKEWQNFERYNINIAQTFFDGNVGVEGAYDRQSYDNGQLVFMSDKGQALYIDVIKILPDGSDNPNFGRPLIADGPGNNRVTFIEREARRLTAFMKHDFEKTFKGSLIGRILGEQRVTAFANRETRSSDSRRFLRYGTDQAFRDAVYGTRATTGTRGPIDIPLDDARSIIYPTVYLGPSLANRTTPAGANIPAPTAVQVATSGTVRFFDSTWTAPAGVNAGDVWIDTNYPVGNTRRTSTQSENPANYRGWTTMPFTVIDSEKGSRDALTVDANLGKTRVSSKAAVWNGYFWDGGLVGLFGLREDTSKAWAFAGQRMKQRDQVINPFTGVLDPVAPNNGAVNLKPTIGPRGENAYLLPAAARDIITEKSKSWSVVAHLSQLFPKVPTFVDISLFYNQSQNFAATAGRVGVYNENLGPPEGDTKDMGILIATKSGKYSLKINKYESRITNASSGAGVNLFYLPSLVNDYTRQKNVFKYKIDTNNSFDLSGSLGTTNPQRWTWSPIDNQTQAQTDALQASAITAWEAMLAQIPQAFYDAYRLPVLTQVTAYAPVTPAGLTVTEDNVSKGYEAELYASPIKNLRLTFNASKVEAVRDNVGQASLVETVNIINTALNTTDAGKMRNSSSATATTALANWNANFMAQYNGVKQQQGGKVPEMREWRANVIANYDFSNGWMKGINIGGGYRWQSKVIIGYAPKFVNSDGTLAANHVTARAAILQLDKPFYGPDESAVDLWIGYRRALTRKITFRTQLNVRNVGKGNYLIPITVQPDGTTAGVRIGPTQVWTLTNTLEF
jgi:hypothetical protein